MDSATEQGDETLDSALLTRWRSGDPTIKKQVHALIYSELRRLATTFMRRERHNHTLQATALVNEALTRLVSARSHLKFIDEHHFYATTARMMRRVLVDHAKARNAEKRGGGTHKPEVSLHLAIGSPTEGGIDLVELDDALDKLEEINLEGARAVELHYFAGLTLERTAQLMGVSVSTVTRQVRFAKAWLMTQLTGTQH